MRKLLLLLPILLIGCGKLEVNVTDMPTTLSAGLYYFSEITSGTIDGPIELRYNYDNSMDVVSTGSLLRSQNFNGTYGTHPRIRFSRVYPIAGTRLVYSNNVNYSTSNDLEVDGTSTNITGNRYTSYTFQIVNNDLYLTINIYSQSSSTSGGINNIVATRVFKGLRTD